MTNSTTTTATATANNANANANAFRILSKRGQLSAALAAGCTTVLLLVAVVAIGDHQRAEQMAQRAAPVQVAVV